MIQIVTCYYSVSVYLFCDCDIFALSCINQMFCVSKICLLLAPDSAMFLSPGGGGGD